MNNLSKRSSSYTKNALAADENLIEKKNPNFFIFQKKKKLNNFLNFSDMPILTRH